MDSRFANINFTWCLVTLEALCWYKVFQHHFLFLMVVSVKTWRITTVCLLSAWYLWLWWRLVHIWLLLCAVNKGIANITITFSCNSNSNNSSFWIYVYHFRWESFGLWCRNKNISMFHAIILRELTGVLCCSVRGSIMWRKALVAALLALAVGFFYHGGPDLQEHILQYIGLPNFPSSSLRLNSKDSLEHVISSAWQTLITLPTQQWSKVAVGWVVQIPARNMTYPDNWGSGCVQSELSIASKYVLWQTVIKLHLVNDLLFECCSQVS